ncbi:hypothetical protein [Thalassobacillus pellis]|uniref:hypothetical protein n=1 Tax=Thalassobacillus pellis TaxID=748008 RepID=UPI001960FAF1|nr:hypothetical protein [Thalassobacillus pellis]MBM7554578.1 hypothetical protein [Thalassobacillus pellis]
MKKRWLSISMFALILVSLIPISSAEAAGNGSWDRILSGTLDYNPTYGFCDSANARSTGGDVLIRGEVPYVTYELWESDPGSGNDDYIGKRYLTPEKINGIFRGINWAVDGSNNRAELYVKVNGRAVDGKWVGIWD